MCRGVRSLKGVELPQGTKVRLLSSLRRRAYEETTAALHSSANCLCRYGMHFSGLQNYIGAGCSHLTEQVRLGTET